VTLFLFFFNCNIDLYLQMSGRGGHPSENAVMTSICRGGGGGGGVKVNWQEVE